MKIVFPEINNVFDCGNMEGINCLIIENQKLLYRILMDINSQLNGYDGETVLSENNKVLSVAKNLELISQFIPFEINQKSLIGKVTGVLGHMAVDEEHYMKTMELMGEIEKWLLDLSVNITGSVDYTKISPDNILKASGLEFIDDYDSLGEKLFDYFELVSEYDRSKLFVLLNLRSFISDEEAESFFDTILMRGYQVLLIEGNARCMLKNEKRYLIDDNLCEIC